MTYVSILSVWLLIVLYKLPDFLSFIIAGALGLLVGTIIYFMLKLGLSLIYLFTNKIGIYKVFFWYGLFAAVAGIISMLIHDSDKSAEAGMMVPIAIAMSIISREAYFDFREIMNKSN